MLTQYFHNDSRASCNNFEGLFGGVKLWRIYWNLSNSPTFSPAKVLRYTVVYKKLPERKVGEKSKIGSSLPMYIAVSIQ